MKIGKAGRCLLTCLLSWGLCIMGAVSSLAASQDLWYLVTELTVPDGYVTAEVTGMNNLGDVVGIVSATDSRKRAILWDRDKQEGVILPLLAGYEQSYAYGLNDAGQVSGYCTKPPQYEFLGHQACIWDKDGGVTALPRPTYDFRYTVARGINAAGQVVGWGWVLGMEKPVLWQNGQSTVIGRFQQAGVEFQTHGVLINAQGQVAGDYLDQYGAQGHAFHWTSGGGFTNLNPDGGLSIVHSINAVGQMAGRVQFSGDSWYKPCRWISGIPSLLAEGYGAATGINDLGQVVGFANMPFLLDGEQTINLEQTIAPGSAWYGVRPWAINNGMQIAATALIRGDPTVVRAILLNPVTRKYRFRIVDLGQGVNPMSINRAGEIVGAVGNRAFLWHGGKMRWTASAESVANAINGAGTSVGWAEVGGVSQAVLWSSQGIMALLTGPGGVSETGAAMGVNNSLVAAGTALDAKGQSSPCIWKDGKRQFLVPGQRGLAFDINDSGLVAGYADGKPFAWSESGGLKLLSANPGSAVAVNNLGEAAGQMNNSPCIWNQQGQVMFLTDNLPGEAGGINFSGQVVGFFSDGFEQWAFLWDAEYGMMNLNRLLISPEPDWQLTHAADINMDMQIIGVGQYKGVQHGFLLQRVGTSVTEAVIPLLLE